MLKKLLAVTLLLTTYFTLSTAQAAHTETFTCPALVGDYYDGQRINDKNYHGDPMKREGWTVMISDPQPRNNTPAPADGLNGLKITQWTLDETLTPTGNQWFALVCQTKRCDITLQVLMETYAETCKVQSPGVFTCKQS
jgi:hypothetical protein